MPHDPALIAETREWLARSRVDLEAAGILAKNNLSAPAAFHAQQAAEKAEKAFLTWHGESFSKTHDLGALGADCVKLDSTLASACSAVAMMSGYAVESRYPGPWNEPTAEEVQEALKLARDVYEAIAARIPKEARP